jgi:hypothetical protein
VLVATFVPLHGRLMHQAIRRVADHDLDRLVLVGRERPFEVPPCGSVVVA